MNQSNPNERENKQDSWKKPDKETTHTPDPQKNMEGPVSSAMHQTGDAFNTDETKEQADERKNENM